jgi:8-oxo-dGTP diphosphatase
MLSYERDNDVLQRFAAMSADGTIDSFALIALRHAKAEFDSESGADADRLLTSVGLEQARAIVPVLQAFGPTVVVTSPAARCLATVAPIVKAMKLPVKERVAISQDGWESEGHQPGRLRRLVEKRIERGQTAIICSHAPVLPEVLEQIAEATSSPNGARISRAGILATAEFSVVHLARRPPHRILGIETHSAAR